MLLSAAIFLSGCDHHKTASPPAAASHGDSALTGQPAEPIDSVVKYPRATLVALPPGYSIPPATNLSATAVPPPATTSSSASAPATPNEPTVANASPTNAPPLPEPVPTASASTPTPPVSAPIPAPAGTGSSPSNPPPISAGASNQLVAIETFHGRIVIELDDFAAPKTCKNFRQLVQDGFYNNTVFHRVIPNFIIQGGDPKSKSSATNRDTYGLGGPGYTLPPEIELKHDRGAVAMARLPDFLNPKRESSGSQFYICLAACPSLDDQYTVFGHVIQGMDVADKIAEAARDKRDNPLTRIEMTMNLQSKETDSAEAGSAQAGSAAGP
jgi:cyclophilin family peptidyl-prolyl cis-trans isomerase